MAMEVGNPRRSTPGSGGKGEGLDSASRRVSQSLSFPICKVRDRDSNHLTELLQELNCHLMQCLRGHREDDGDGGNARWLGLTRLFRTRAPISGGSAWNGSLYAPHRPSQSVGLGPPTGASFGVF